MSAAGTVSILLQSPCAHLKIQDLLDGTVGKSLVQASGRIWAASKALLKAISVTRTLKQSSTVQSGSVDKCRAKLQLPNVNIFARHDPQLV